MSLAERFAQYAATFEEVYKRDDWSLLDEYFTEDAVYETFADPPFGGVLEGRDAIFSQLKTILDTFDRRFESRDLKLIDGPNEQDGAVWIRWRVTYRVGTAPALVIEGEETAHFEGDRIRRLAIEQLVDHIGDAAHLRWAKSARCNGVRTQTYAAGYFRGL